MTNSSSEKFDGMVLEPELSWLKANFSKIALSKIIELRRKILQRNRRQFCSLRKGLSWHWLNVISKLHKLFGNHKSLDSSTTAHEKDQNVSEE